MKENGRSCCNKCIMKRMKCVAILAMLQRNRGGTRSICCKKCTKNKKNKKNVEPTSTIARNKAMTRQRKLQIEEVVVRKKSNEKTEQTKKNCNKQLEEAIAQKHNEKNECVKFNLVNR